MIRIPAKIGVMFGHAASNIGDLAINRGQIELLREAFPGAQFQVCYLNVETNAYLDDARASFGEDGDVVFSYFKSHSEKALSYVADPVKFLQDCGVAEADLIVLSSGEHLFYYGHGENIISFFWRTLPAYAAKAAGKRCILLPSTLGPFEKAQASRLASCLLRLVDDYAVRDSRSGPILEKTLGLDRVPKVFLDPAFFLRSPAQPIDRRDPSSRERSVALVMRAENWGIRLSKELKAGVGKGGSENVRSTVAFRYANAFLHQVLSAPDCSVTVFVQTQADDELAQALAEGHGQDGRFVIYRPRSVDDYLRQLSLSDVVVASRFHAIILGAVLGKPGLGVYFNEHGHKMAGLFELIGSPERCINLSTHDTLAAASESASFALTVPLVDTAVQSRISELRDSTLQWIRQVPERPMDVDTLLEAGRAYGVFAADIAVEGMRASADSKLKAARKASEALMQNNAKLDRKLFQAQQELSVNSGELKRAQADLKDARNKLESALDADAQRTWEHGVELNRLRLAAARDVWTERDKWTSLLAFRAGNVLVEGIGRPLRWPLLPFRLFSEWRAFKRDQQNRAAFAHAPPKIESTEPSAAPAKKERIQPDALKDPAVFAVMLREEGISAIVDRIARERALDGKALASELLKRGKAFAEQGEKELEPPLAKAATEIDDSAGTLRGAFWAWQRAGDYVAACDAIMKTERVLASSQDESELQTLAKMKATPAYQLSSLSLVEQQPKTYQFRPEPGRICYVLHNSLPFSSGGYAVRSHGVATGLARQGHDVICITRPGFPYDIKPDLDRGTVDTDQVLDGIRYVRIEQPHSKRISVPNYVARCADVLTRRFEDLKPELVIAASNYRIGLMAMIAARRLGIPFIYEVRGWWELTRLSRDTSFLDTPSYAVQSELERAVAIRSDHVFTLTEPMREALLAQGVHADGVTLLPNSCDVERFEPGPRSSKLARRLSIPDHVPVIGYVGTFVDYEGLEDLAEACGVLAGRGLDFRLLMVGNENTSGHERGPITAQILEAAEKGGFTERLIMPGRVPHEEVEEYYSLIDIAPFPRKPWPVCEMVSPMKPLEALAMEKAVVVSDVRALAEMIQDGETGLLFSKGDIASLADVLERLMRNEELRRKLGERGRRWVEGNRTWTGAGTVASRVISDVVQRARDT